ncbi:MAG: Ig-like domain-containing protein, partial [Bacteroidaceae bacterium]|nr:Ig-like domain-containing protein [Bacteroidaceae bacterium]
MKKTFLSLAMLLSTMAVSAQSETYVGDMNDDGELNISDVTQLVNTVIGKQAPRKVSLGGGAPYAVDNSAIAGTWRTTSGEVITFNADGTCKISNTAYTFEYMPQLGFIAVYDSNGECPLSYNVLKKTKDMLLLNTMAQTGGKFYYTSAMFVTAIKLSSTSVNLNTGQTHQLTATVTPANAKVPTLKWTSSSTGVATVDQTGLVTAKKGGKATITATSTDGTGVKATCTFNITQLVTSVTLPYTTLNIGKGSTFTLDATVSPTTANNDSLAWTSSSAANVMYLNKNKFYAMAAGTSTITAAATDGSGKKATCKVTVLSAAPTGVSLSAKSLSIKPSESAQLTATVTPSGASTATVIWTSSDPSIATVDKTGKVTAVGTEGKATITAKVVGDGSPEAQAEVKVQSDTHEYVDLDLPSGTLWAT